MRLLALLLVFYSGAAQAFQSESFGDSTPMQLLEAGLATPDSVPLPLYFLSEGDYPKALAALSPEVEARFPWLRAYLTGAWEASRTLEKQESDNFILFTPPDQKFLAVYALPALEKAAATFEGFFGHRPSSKIWVEIYPDKESFSKASTLSVPILENSGAIGICKFHRLMIMSPQALPLGYRWLDALAHEYGHLIINELTHTRMELWLHEGTARYFDTAWRSAPPVFLTPHQKSELLTALDEDRLVTFSRMSPSLVYLDDQKEVSLAFAQVSHAVSRLVERHGVKRFGRFLRALQKSSFNEAFLSVFRLSPDAFEAELRAALAKEKWPRTRGTLSDEVQFRPVAEDTYIGADAKGQVRLGDRMRLRGLHEAALLQYEKALEQEPDNAVILLKAARMHLAEGQIEAAVRRLRTAIDRNPNYGTPYLELAGLVEPKEAVDLYLEANAINPFDSRVHSGLAEAYQKLGRQTEAQTEREISDQLKSQMSD